MDASGILYGGCLMQKKFDGQMVKKVIVFVSKAFNAAERKYSTVGREVAAIRFCMKALMTF